VPAAPIYWNPLFDAVWWVTTIIFILTALLAALLVLKRGRGLVERVHFARPISTIPRRLPARSQVLLWAGAVGLLCLAVLFPPRKQFGAKYFVDDGDERPRAISIERVMFLPLRQITRPQSPRDLLPDSTLKTLFRSTRDRQTVQSRLDSLWRAHVASHQNEQVVVWGWASIHFRLLLMEFGVVLLPAIFTSILLRRRSNLPALRYTRV